MHECPKLFFLDDVSPIYLHTDASQYGMGAYLFQVREEGGVNREVPIRFLSKSFVTACLVGQRFSKKDTLYFTPSRHGSIYSVTGDF